MTGHFEIAQSALQGPGKTRLIKLVISARTNVRLAHIIQALQFIHAIHALMVMFLKRINADRTVA